MRCSQCGHENALGVKFCGECGARLQASCPACGAANPAANKFCQECGSSLAPVPAASSSGVAAGTRYASPAAYTPKHLAEKILTSSSAMAGERKRVTVM